VRERPRDYSGTVAITLTVLTVGFCFLTSTAANDNNGVLGCLFLLPVVSAVFTIIWTIVGAVSLWRDNINCPGGELHDMIWTSVIIHFISTVLLVCGGKRETVVV
jgi:hypothetical protein